MTIPKVNKIYEYAIIYRSFDSSEENLLDSDGKNVHYHTLMPTKRYWYADPLLLVKDGRPVVYMEVYDCLKRKGFIGKSEFASNGRLKRPEKMIEEPFHMSFPMTFYYRGSLYMIPETVSSGELKIYREVDTDRWELYYSKPVDAGLVDVILYDDPNGLDDKDEITLLVGERKEKDRELVRAALYGVTNLDSVKEIVIKRKSELSDYSLTDRNGGRILRTPSGEYRVRQYSEREKYGIKLLVDRLNREKASEDIGISSPNVISTKEITVKDIAWEIPATTSKKRRRLISDNLVGIHTYDMTDTCEVLDIAWECDNIYIVMGIYGRWLLQAVRRRLCRK